jgi:hypothetical protein
MSGHGLNISVKNVRNEDISKMKGFQYRDRDLLCAALMRRQ